MGFAFGGFFPKDLSKAKFQCTWTHLKQLLAKKADSLQLWLSHVWKTYLEMAKRFSLTWLAALPIRPRK